ncbi:aminotransferase class I/II-fold pyridoxal phosphate-dependent enzyme [Sphingomonas sp. ID1715]|uniref:pyridoxal phosphate-dependent aminotransferase n=1 Tax=Sphingomonas sp. ID1715 TaxID=1656898 RepID=UPI0014899230|nr:pyridoxal phosphate-dependent aminotransferase [Sphingomonas sp. ID1715]NNM77872.1 aminotransferase class I/II-fold pyridoxal phosphate-dependent enzyme [Sphingomonas sp. ID1715]
MRVLQSEYMYWAKNQPAARFPLSSSEVPACHLDRFPITLADLELDGRSRYRYLPLREAIGRRHGVGPEQVVLADGTSMANMLAMAALITPGDEVLVEHPVYEPMVAAARFLGARIRTFERKAPEFALDPAAIEATLSSDTRLILLTNLHNPSSGLASTEALQASAELAQRVGAHVLVDEVYRDATYPLQPSAVTLGDRFIVTSSLTKCYGLSGIRCGWIIAPPDLAERMWRLNELFGVAQSHAAERLACVAFEHFDEIARPLTDLLPRNRALFNDWLKTRADLDCALLTGGITAFPRLIGASVDDLHRLLREEYETSIVPGAFFGAPDHFRVGMGSATELVGEGLDRLGAALDRLR